MASMWSTGLPYKGIDAIRHSLRSDPHPLPPQRAIGAPGQIAHSTS